MAADSDDPAHEGEPWCPSAGPDWRDAHVFGVVMGTATQPRVSALVPMQPVNDRILNLAGPVPVTQVFRIGAPCIGVECQHHAEGSCRLGKAIVRELPPVADGLPRCGLRPDCLWWRQSGAGACHRCPQVVTDDPLPTRAVLRAAVGR